MMSHTCLTPPTGVPVEVITHCAWLLGPPLGTCNELPAGHVVPPGVGKDGEGAAPAVAEMPAADRARSMTDAVTITPFRTPCRNLCGLRTSPPQYVVRSERAVRSEQR